tara:strand:- start:690 stop:854 length:165 start_codon:yes stop_codon:yes gene_type:complete
MNNEIKSLDNGDFEVIYPQGKDKPFFERVVIIGLGVWFATVAIAGVVGTIIKLA